MTFSERSSLFMDKIAFIPFHECWEWTGCIGRGYGLFWNGVKLTVANRVAWEIFRGPIPKGMMVCHACDNRSCVNPDHLFLGSHMDNVRDAMRKKRHCFGTRNGNSILRESDIPQIRDLLKYGMFQRTIAAHYGVSQRLVLNISKGRAWKHVPMIP